MAPRIVDRSFLGVSHPMLDFGECLFDGIEVGRIGWQEPEPCTGGADHPAHIGGLVRSQIVHNDDVARLEYGHELLLDPGAKALAVDRPIEDARRGQAIPSQGADEGQGTPVTVRGEAAQTFALGSPSAQRRHVGLDPCFIDEDQPPGIKASLKGPPSPTPARNIATCLLKGKQRFF